MIDYETYCKIQQYAKQQLSATQIAQKIGLDKRTVRRWLTENFRQAEKKCKTSMLDPYKDQINAWLEQHTYSAQQIYQKLQALEYPGKYGMVKEYVRKVRPKRLPAYLSLAFAPGECAQVDWGEYGTIQVGQTRRRLSFFAMVLCHSRLLYVEFCVSKTMEFFLGAHQRAFEYFGGTPKKIMVDNLKSAVLSRVIGQAPVFNKTYLAFAKHYDFTIKACGVAKGNEKGRVENAVGYIKKNFLSGLTLSSVEALNLAAQQWLNDVANIRVHGSTQKVPREVFDATEQLALRPLPLPFDIGNVKSVRATKQFRVHFEGNRYSVPAEYASKRLTIKAYPEELLIYAQDKLIAKHPRSFDRNQDFEHPDHPKALLAQRRNARHQKALQRFLTLTPKAQIYYQQLELRRLNAAHHVLQIVALSEIYPPEQCAQAIEDALEFNVFSSEYIVNLLEQRNRIQQETGILHVTRRQDLLDLTTHQPDLNIYE